MSLLSTITGSLPNVLNLLQGKWDVQYKIGKDDTGWVDWIIHPLDSLATSSWVSWLNSRPNPNDGYKWESLDFDSFVDIQEIAETDITKNPIEGGSFRSSNKVVKPKQVKVTLAKAGIGYGIEDSLATVKMLLPLARYGGQKKQRYGLSGIIDNARDSVVNSVKSWLGDFIGKKEQSNDFPMEFRILTPFDMITKLNLVKLDYSFTKENGRNMLLMYLTFEEILDMDNGSGKMTDATNARKSLLGRISLLG